MNKISSNITKFSIAAGSVLTALLTPATVGAQKLLDCDKIKTEGINVACSSDTNFVSSLIGKVIILILVIAVILALVFLIYGGIRYILSGGDKDGTAAARKTIISALIGLALVFLSFVIISVVGNILGVNVFNINLGALNIANTK